MSDRHSLPLFPALALALALAGCAGAKEPQPSPSDLFGPSTATGTIVGTGASLYRRGTHVLLVENRPRFFLESKTVNLNQYEGDSVVIQGEISPNTHPSFLPVIEVVSVVPRSAELTLELQKYDVPSLRLSLEAPREWKNVLSGTRLTFHRAENLTPVVEVEMKTLNTFPEGFPVRVGGRNGVRVVEEGTGRHFVSVSRGGGEITLFTFTPEEGDTGTLRDAFYALLQTVQFVERIPESSSSSSSSTSAVPFIPCGGSAHVLCPAGMYCEVREWDTGIGACKPL